MGGGGKRKRKLNGIEGRGGRYPVSESARFLPARTVNGDNSFSDGLIFNGEFVEGVKERKREKERNKQRRLRVDSLLCVYITRGATVLKFIIKKFANCNVEICFFFEREGGINIHFLSPSRISICNDSFTCDRNKFSLVEMNFWIIEN